MWLDRLADKNGSEREDEFSNEYLADIVVEDEVGNKDEDVVIAEDDDDANIEEEDDDDIGMDAMVEDDIGNNVITFVDDEDGDWAAGDDDDDDDDDGDDDEAVDTVAGDFGEEDKFPVVDDDPVRLCTILMKLEGSV